MNRNIGRLALATVAMIVVMSMIGERVVASCTCINNDCYEDLVVHSAGSNEANGTYRFVSIYNGNPRYSMLGNPGLTVWYGSTAWGLWEGAIVLYYVVSAADTPPSTGWVCQPSQGQEPPPTVFGGEACFSCTAPQLSGSPPASVLLGSSFDFAPTTSGTCEISVFTVVNLPSWADFDPLTGRIWGTPRNRDLGVYENISITSADAWNRTDTIGPFDIEVKLSLQIVPLGDVGVGSILDRASALTSQEETVIHSLRIRDEDGNPTCGSPLHVCVYQIDYSSSPPTRTLINYLFVSCNPLTGVYEYEVPAYAMSSPYYDVVLSFAEEPNVTQPLTSLWSGSIPSALPADGQSGVTMYEAGEAITGKCQILHANGLPTVTSYIHAYLYSVDASTRPETNTLVDHWIVRVSSGTSIYNLNIDTTDLVPGDYQIRLAFEDGTIKSLRVRIVSPG